MAHIPYKAGADRAGDLIEGRVQVAFDAAPAAIQNAKSGKARIIAVAAPSRKAFLPDMPTVSEQGVKDVDIVSFLGWFGPKGMAPDDVKKLNAALAQAIAQPAVRDFYKTGAYTAESSSPEVWPARCATPERAGARWSSAPTSPSSERGARPRTGGRFHRCRCRRRRLRVGQPAVGRPAPPRVVDRSRWPGRLALVQGAGGLPLHHRQSALRLVLRW